MSTLPVSSFGRLLYTDALSAAADLMALPTGGEGVLPGTKGRYLYLRAWGEQASGAGEQAEVDVLYSWGNQKGALAARLVFTFGTSSNTGSPLVARSIETGVTGKGAGPFYEADHVRWAAYGLVTPLAVYRESGGSLVVVLPTLGALGISARCNSLTSATVLLGGLVTDEYVTGSGDPGVLTLPDSASGTLTGVNGRWWVWIGQQRRIEIWNLGSVPLYGRRGGTAGSGAGEWDFIVFPDSVTVLRTPTWLVALYATAAMTEGVDYGLFGEEGGRMDG